MVGREDERRWRQFPDVTSVHRRLIVVRPQGPPLSSDLFKEMLLSSSRHTAVPRLHCHLHPISGGISFALRRSWHISEWLNIIRNLITNLEKATANDSWKIGSKAAKGEDNRELTAAFGWVSLPHTPSLLWRVVFVLVSHPHALSSSGTPWESVSGDEESNVLLLSGLFILSPLVSFSLLHHQSIRLRLKDQIDGGIVG